MSKFVLLFLFVLIALNKRIRIYIHSIAPKFEQYIGALTISGLVVALYCTSTNERYLFHKLILRESEKEIFDSMQCSPNVRLYTPVHRFLGALVEYQKEKNIAKSL